MSNYYQHPFVSNSQLSALKLELMAPDEQREFKEAYRLGTLVHAIILEPHTVDYIQRTVIGTGYSYTDAEINTARKMKVAFLNDAFCRMLLDTCEKEVEMYNEGTQFEHNGVEFTLNTKRKYDGWNRATGWGFDLKSTTATSQAQFEQAVRRFDYDRGRVFYAAGSGALQDVIIGISKVNFKVFKVFMRHGDALWREGERKMQELAFKYWAIKEGVAV